MRYKAYKVITVTVFFLFSIATAFAQQVPCSGDPDDDDYDPNGCPLDTWVIVLAFAAVLFASIHLFRKQRSALKKTGS